MKFAYEMLLVFYCQEIFDFVQESSKYNIIFLDTANSSPTIGIPFIFCAHTIFCLENSRNLTFHSSAHFTLYKNAHDFLIVSSSTQVAAKDIESDGAIYQLELLDEKILIF